MEQIEKPTGNYAVAVLGAVVGGIIGTLPWILGYVYANMMYSFLTVCIPIAAYKGFEICKGKVDKKLPIILGVISFVMITLATLVIIPNLLILKEYGQISFEMFKALFEFAEFKSAIIQDYIYSLLFTAAGAGYIVMNIKKSIDAGDDKVSFTAPIVTPNDDEIDAVKEVFKKRQAMSKDHTLSKDDVKNELKGKESTLNFLLARGIIVRRKGEYYYSEENEQHPGKRAVKIFAITFVSMIVLVGLLVIVALAFAD